MGLPDVLNRPVSASGSDLEWPLWLPAASVVGAVVATVAALADRDALVPPGPEILFGLLIVGPWLTESVCHWMPPRPLFAACVIAGVAGLLLDPTEIDIAPFLLVMVVGEVAATASLTVTAGVVLAATSVMVVGELRQLDGTGLWIAGIGAAAAMGAGMQSRLRLLHQERATSAEREGRAAIAERQRIAREIHDVIAHSLSVTMLHVTGTRHLLETEADVDEAVAALRDAERLGRQAMVDIRRTVGLLGADAPQTTPMPGLAELDDLVADFRAAGLDVRYQLRGDTAALSLATGLGLYRIAQESLANVAKHAPGAQVDVGLDLTSDHLRLTVRNTLPAGPPGVRLAVSGTRDSAAFTPGEAGAGTTVGPATDGDRVPRRDPLTTEVTGTGGMGLAGMRQRATLMGGVLTAGLDGGDWCVEVLVPATTEGVS